MTKHLTRIWIWSLICYLVLELMTSCSPSRTTTHNSVWTDSTTTARIDSMQNIITKLYQTLHTQIQSSGNTRVVFDSVSVPYIVLDSSKCPQDSSLYRVIAQLQNYIRAINNKVVVLANGNTEYQGHIAEVIQQLSQSQETTSTLYKEHQDSLKVLHDLRQRIQTLQSSDSTVVKKRAIPWTAILLGVLIYAVLRALEFIFLSKRTI